MAKADPKKPSNSTSNQKKIAKTQLIVLVTQRTSLSKKQASDAVDCIIQEITQALQMGKTVGLPGLGTFSITGTVARQGVRPGSRERITIPAGKKIRFKAATTLKNQI